MGRALVVVRPGLDVGAHHEGAAGHEDLRRERLGCRGNGAGGRQGVVGRAPQLDGGGHGLVVLLLVLHDHPVHQAPVEEGRRFVEVHPIEHVEDAPSHVAHVAAGVGGAEQGEGGPVAPRVQEGVVDPVEMWRQPRRGHRAQQPLLFVVADVGQVPDQRRHQGRVLADEAVIGNGSQQIE